MRSLRPVERLTEGQLRCADAPVAKHHIVLGVVREGVVEKVHEGSRGPIQIQAFFSFGIEILFGMTGTAIYRPSTM